MIELEEHYQELILKGFDSLNAFEPGIIDLLMLIPGNCVQVMPVPTDHLIFSPPYAQALAKKGKVDQFTADTLGQAITDYTASAGNIGQMNDFYYNHRMEKVYQRCFECLSSGGTMSVIIKDRMRIKDRKNRF